jgi:glycogen operon protein
LIAMRRANPTLRRKEFLRGEPWLTGELPDVSWFGADGTGKHWDEDDPSLICVFGAPAKANEAGLVPRHVMLLLHAGHLPRSFTLPQLVRTIGWRKFADTAAEPPNDIFPDFDGPAPPPNASIELEGHSLVCYAST